MGVVVKANNGKSLSLSSLYWGWIRHIAKEEGVTLPQSGSSTETITGDDVKKLASAIRVRAEKIRKGLAPHNASSYVKQFDEALWSSKDKEKDAGTVRVDFDNPEDMDKTADFFDSSGGVTMTY